MLIDKHGVEVVVGDYVYVDKHGKSIYAVEGIDAIHFSAVEKFVSYHYSFTQHIFDGNTITKLTNAEIAVKLLMT